MSAVLLCIATFAPHSTSFTPLSQLSRLGARTSTSKRDAIRIQRINRIRKITNLDMASVDSQDEKIQFSATTIAPERKQENLRLHANSDQQGKRHQNSKKHGGKPYKKKPFGKKQTVKRMFRQAKEMERTGQWRQACIHLEKILEIDPRDSYTHLALARLQSRRERSSTGEKRPSIDIDKKQIVGIAAEGSSFDETQVNITALDISQTLPFSNARQAFFNGTEMCPDSIHIWQAWALFEDSLGNLSYARSLFQRALEIDESNPYVCHGYGLLEHRCGNFLAAQEMWERPLKTGEKGKITAALVCSLANLMIAKKELHEARDLYKTHVLLIDSQRESAEVYLAFAWLEEKHFNDFKCAEEQLNLALRVSPGNSRAMVALAKLEGRKVDSQLLKSGMHGKNDNASNSGSKRDVKRQVDYTVKKELEDACIRLIEGHKKETKTQQSDVKDGRLFNAWAKLEVKHKNFGAARKILKRGMDLFPHDHSVRYNMRCI